MATKGSKGAVVAALIGNFTVMVAKFIAFGVTGLSSMLSEAIHTLADLLNQILLLIGIVRSGKTPDQEADYGYASERYVWALISAVGIFFLGCGVTIYHGIESIMYPHGHVVADAAHDAAHAADHAAEQHGGATGIYWAIGVLIFALIVEAYVLWVAVKAVLDQADGAPFFSFMRSEADPATVAVVLEDSAACLGCVLALIAIILYQVTGWAYWDAIGSLAIGALLGALAIWLVWRNSQLLVGVSVPPRIRQQVAKIIQDNPAVEEVVDLKTRILDTETYRIKADVRFDGEALADKLLNDVDKAYDKIQNKNDFRKFARDFADDIVELLADEIDAIEKRIQQEVPKARHMDFEAD